MRSIISAQHSFKPISQARFQHNQSNFHSKLSTKYATNDSSPILIQNYWSNMQSTWQVKHIFNNISRLAATFSLSLSHWIVPQESLFFSVHHWKKHSFTVSLSLLYWKIRVLVFRNQQNDQYLFSQFVNEKKTLIP